ncbi:MAG: hypothetical protein ACREDS_14260 [Limisphaerales bacterium]
MAGFKLPDDNNVGMADMPQACGTFSGQQYLLLPNGSNILWSSSSRTDTPKMVLHTGGKGTSSRQNLFELSASATEALPNHSTPLSPKFIRERYVLMVSALQPVLRRVMGCRAGGKVDTNRLA